MSIYKSIVAFLRAQHYVAASGDAINGIELVLVVEKQVLMETT